MSANVTSIDQIKLFWDYFFHAETGTYEKSSWLDLLLAEFLIQLKNGIECTSIISFCPVGGVVTLIGCELLCGVHCVTSSSCSHYIQPSQIALPSEGCFPKFHALGQLNKHNHFLETKEIIDEKEPKYSINSIGSSSKSGLFQTPQSSLLALQKYLLKGPAWRCMALLQSLGVEGLSCSRQLSGVLIWLYGELSGAGGICHGPNPYIPKCHKKPPIQDLFSNKIWINKRPNRHHSSHRPSNIVNDGNNDERKSSQFSRSRRKSSLRNGHTKADSIKSNGRDLFINQKNIKIHNVNQTSDSEHANDELQMLNRSFTLKAKYNPNDFEYFTSVIRSDEEMSNTSFYSPVRRPPQKKKPTVEDYSTDKHKEVINSEISQFEFSVIVIDLLHQLCKAEPNTVGSETLHINVQCVDFAIRHLCTLQFESSPASRVHLNSSESTHLKASLTELLIISLDKVLMHPDLSIKIIHNGLLPMLLRLLEDTTYKLHVRFDTNGELNGATDGVESNLQKLALPESDEAADLMKYLFGLTYSIMAFFYCLLMQRRSFDKLHDFTEQFKLFGDCKKGLLFRESISLIMRIPGVDKDDSATLARKLIDFLGRLISGMKRIRREVVHSESCPLNKHKNCHIDVTADMHHHNDVLGTSCPLSGSMIMSSVCCVATLYGTLVSLLGDANLTSHSILRTKLLRCMRSCGSCCCFSPQYLLDKIIRIIHSHHGVANLCFSVLEHTLYRELGAIRKHNGSEKLSCYVCERYFVIDIECLQNNIHNSTKNKIVWPFLAKYNSLLQIEDHSVLHATMSHLLRISSYCKNHIKHDLLFTILYPTFLSIKSLYLQNNSDGLRFIMLSCLNSFSTLLSSTEFAEEFIQKNGLTSILQLMALPEFSKQCCSVLEIAVIIEIFNMFPVSCDPPNERVSPNMFNHNDVKNLSSLQMLFKSLNDINIKAFKYLKLKLSKSLFVKLIDNDIDCQYCGMDQYAEELIGNNSVELLNNTSTSFKKSQPVYIQSASRTPENVLFDMQYYVLEENSENHTEILKHIWTFWKSCSALCLYSPLVRKYLVRQKIFKDSFKLMKLLLYCVCNNTTTISQTDGKLLMMILESIIVTNIAVSDCTMNRSKAAVVALLREEILSEKSNTVDAGNMKTLCEMLIRASTTYASEDQVMPPVTKAKLPPLLFASHSDDECPSSGDEDDSVRLRPYMSEGSDPYHTADEGYEADVEIGALEMASSDKVFASSNGNHNLEQSVQSPNPRSGHSATLNSSELDCKEYKKNNCVIHPELCSMVVDILISLIDRILKTEETLENESLSSSSTLCGIVCSCVSRLSTILYQETNYSTGRGLISQILTSPATKLLKVKKKNLEELQRSVLHLIYVLASRSIAPVELKLYLQLFTSSNLPLHILLEPLSRLVENVHPNIPDFIVCFPVEKFTNIDGYVPKESTSLPTFLNSSDYQESQMQQFAKSLHYYHTKAGIQSSWSDMAVWCCVEGVNWGLWLQGCSVGMWLRVQEEQCQTKSSDMSQFSQSEGSSTEGYPEEKNSNNKESKMKNKADLNSVNSSSNDMSAQNSPTSIQHMMSIGHESLMIEFWVNTKNGDVIIKLTRPDIESNRVLGETIVEECLPLYHWNHLAMNIKETMHKRNIFIEVTIFINGSEPKVAAVPLNGILLRKALPACLTMGHSASSTPGMLRPAGHWYMSQLTLYRSPVFNRQNVMYLMAYGPNLSALTSCQSGNYLPNFSTLFISNILSSKIDWDQVLEISSASLKELQVSLLLSYSAHNPLAVDQYHQTVASPTVFGSRVGGAMKASGSGVPVPLTATWTGLFLPSQHRGLLPCVHLLGGPQILLYLFARVVELNGSSEEQALAMSIFLKVSFSDTRLYSALFQGNLLPMLQTVFASSKCQMSYFFLKALLDAACSFPILTSTSNQFNLLLQSSAIIVHPEILVVMLRAWHELESLKKVNKENVSTKGKNNMEADKINGDGSHTEKGARETCTDYQDPMSPGANEKSGFISDNDGGLLAQLFMAMNIMLRDEHPFRNFNVYQMNRVNMIENLLMICKELFLESDLKILSDSASCSLVELVRSLMGAPPLMHHMALITDFLVLMHKDVYIAHARSSFYFTLTPTAQTTTNFNVNMLGLPMPHANKRRSRKNSKKRHSTSNSTSGSQDGTPLRSFSIKSNYPSVQDSEDSYEIITNDSLNDTENTPFDDNIIENSSRSSPHDETKLAKAVTNMQIKQKSARKDKRRRRSKQRKNAFFTHHSNVDGLATDDTGIHSDTTIDDISPNASNSVLAREYVIIESDEMDRQPIHDDSIPMYQQVRSPVLLHNLRTGSTRSWTVCEGLLLLLRDTISIMPDTSLSQMLGVVLHSEMLLILGNHKEASVRTGVVKVICALVQRCSPEDIKHMEQNHFFYHLANQISLYPASYDLVSACCTLVTGCRALIDDQLEDEAWVEVGEKSILKSPPLLAVLPCTLHDVSLTHNTILLLRKLIDKASIKVLTNIGICEVIMKCLKSRVVMKDNLDGRDLILDDLRSLLNQIALKAIVLQQNLQMRSDIHYQLTFLELKGRLLNHNQSQILITRAVRDTQCSLLETELDFLEERLMVDNNMNTNSFNYFTSAQSSPGIFSSNDREGPSPWFPSEPSVKRSHAQASTQKLSRSELLTRHSTVINRAAVFLMSRDIDDKGSALEFRMCQRIFAILININSNTSTGIRSKWWNGLGSSSHHLLTEMFFWIISPTSNSVHLRIDAVTTVCEASPNIMNILTPSDPTNQRKLAVYLIIIFENWQVSSNEESVREFVMRWVSQIMPLQQQPQSETLMEEARHFVAQDLEQRQRLQSQSYPSINKSVFRKESLANKLTETAMLATGLVVNTQNSERKFFLDYLRKQQNLYIGSSQRWHKLIEQLGHELGIWHMQESYPKFWEIEPTEGPSRVRVRLRRCHLKIEKKFLKDGHKEKTESTALPSPLAYLFELPKSHKQQGLLERLHPNEIVNHMTRAVYIAVKNEQNGELLLSDRCIYFLPEKDNASVTGVFWTLDNIASIETRRWQLRERAVEIFLCSGVTHLIAFNTPEDLEGFLCALNICHLPNRYESDTLSETVSLWRNGTITNWDYLIRLNGCAGRTYNDLMQYPVFPFILSNYEAAVLDLNEPTSFRDLTKPISIQNKSNEAYFINYYNILKQAKKDRGCIEEPYHYGSHYSNSGTILHFLVRLSPFTELSMSYHDGKFDQPDRSFFSLPSTWFQASCNSTTDVKELIPEFFYLPHFLCNSEGLNLGVRQDGQSVNDVQVATWSKNARLFILIHRQALESCYVTENLPHWIDLIFGYKQLGQAAFDAINIFHPSTYYGFDATAENESDRIAREAMTRLYGQTPRQLLKYPHPHSITNFQHIIENDVEVLSEVRGLRWGMYCGAPSRAAPNLLWSRPHSTPVVCLVPLLSGEILGLPAHTTLMATYCKTKGLSTYGSTSVGTLGLITWGHSDGIIRIKQRKDVPPVPLIQIHSIDRLCVVAHSSGRSLSGLWLGLQSGRVLVLPPAPVCSSPATVTFTSRPVTLLGHNTSIVAIYVCSAFGVAATASKDGTIIIWDINRLNYVRTIPNCGQKISHICISETLCDVATVYEIEQKRSSDMLYSLAKNIPNTKNGTESVKSDTTPDTDSPADKEDNVKPSISAQDKIKNERSDSMNLKNGSPLRQYQSTIRVHTINGLHVGEVKVFEKITCICYSNAPEGTSVNSIVVGLHNGSIRMFSSWDLKPLRHWSPPNYSFPLVSIIYSLDSHHLYTAGSDGTVMVWEGDAITGKTPNFRTLTSLSMF